MNARDSSPLSRGCPSAPRSLINQEHGKAPQILRRDRAATGVMLVAVFSPALKSGGCADSEAGSVSLPRQDGSSERADSPVSVYHLSFAAPNVPEL